MASTGKDVFAMTKWYKSTGNFRSTPLKDPRFPDRPPATSLAEKREIFIGNLLINPTEASDIPLDAPTTALRSIAFPPLSQLEIQESILKTSNTTPGADEIHTAILRLAWPLIKNHVHSLYNGCLFLGYLPECFRQAILVMLQKPNNSDLSSPRSYRAITLLSVLGKRLERLIAKLIAWIAIRNKILTTQQFGAPPGRSAVDLITCLTHDIERALNEGRTASMLTLDVKGTFDAILPGRLVRRMREQGWPVFLVNWVGSFATVTNEGAEGELDRFRVLGF